jgi:arylsulfatase A-like enzyme
MSPLGSLGDLPPDAPDIILLSIDGWRWDHSSMSNSGLDLTPRIHTHSRRAAVYERAYVLAPSTRQSFRALFSGLIPGRVDAPPAPEARWGVTLADGQPTLAGYLAAAGYETIAFVSDPGAFPVEEHGLDGFSEIDDSFAEFRRRHRYTASYKISHMIARLARPPSPGEPPRFLWTHLNEPHFPFITGPELPSATRLPYHERHNHSVRYVDQQVDRLLDFLAGRERKDNTWVFITSDHGEQFDEHGMRRHGSSVYEEEIRVPLLVWGPGVSPGHRTAPVSLIDLLPTIIGAAGLTPPTGVCGDSLLGNLTAGGEPPRKPVYAAALPDETTDWFSLGFIDGDRKLVIEGHTGAIEYFDLSEDPEEKNNLRREDPTAGDDLLARFRAFYVEHGMDPALYSLGAPEDEGD